MVDKEGKEVHCSCGKSMCKLHNSLVTWYKKEEFEIKNFPHYKCSSGHMKSARKDRVRIRKLLKKAYREGIYIIDFNKNIN